jgi:hypothetical protein
MKMIHSALRIPVVALLVLSMAAVFSGCLISGTESFSKDLGDFNVTANSFDGENVDLTEDSTYEDHQDEIQLVDRVGFSMSLVNVSGVETQVSVYISDNPNLATPAQVKDLATLIFEDLVVPVGGRTIDYKESLDLLQNFSALQDAVERGTFTVYAVAGGDYNVDVNDVVVTITLTFSGD